MKDWEESPGSAKFIKRGDNLGPGEEVGSFRGDYRVKRELDENINQ